MQSYKIHKIDLSQDYPCPCRCRGRLSPIALTEAFGCLQCQHIFVLGDEGRVLEKLVTHYPYKQTWRWTGSQWYRARSGWRENVLPICLLSIAALLAWLFLARFFENLAFVWVLVGLMLTLVPVIHLLSSYRR